MIKWMRTAPLLDVAADHANTETVHLLMAEGAYVPVADQYGVTALDPAEFHAKTVDVGKVRMTRLLRFLRKKS
jgi:hypothetical protein